MSSSETSNLEQGHYARKQIFSRSRLIAWSHRQRFRIGLNLAGELAKGRLLDYGCGDGTFLALLMARSEAPASAMGAEIDDGQVKDCTARFGKDPRLSFVRTAALTPDQYTHAFDALVCMEVLEHVVDRRPLYEHWRYLVKPGGTIMISVPVETGPALAVKQLVRRVAGWRKIGDYPGLAPYTWREFFGSLFAGSRQPFPRPIHVSPTGDRGHCHKGFNWRVVRAELAESFHLERTIGSPLAWLPPGLGSQVWFVLRNPQKTQS